MPVKLQSRFRPGEVSQPFGKDCDFGQHSVEDETEGSRASSDKGCHCLEVETSR